MNEVDIWKKEKAKIQVVSFWDAQALGLNGLEASDPQFLLRMTSLLGLGFITLEFEKSVMYRLLGQLSYFHRCLTYLD